MAEHPTHLAFNTHHTPHSAFDLTSPLTRDKPVQAPHVLGAVGLKQLFNVTTTTPINLPHPIQGPTAGHKSPTPFPPSHSSPPLPLPASTANPSRHSVLSVRPVLNPPNGPKHVVELDIAIALRSTAAAAAETMHDVHRYRHPCRSYEVQSLGCMHPARAILFLLCGRARTTAPAASYY